VVVVVEVVVPPLSPVDLACVLLCVDVFVVASADDIVTSYDDDVSNLKDSWDVERV
jgi:hypothetical protein